MEEVLENIDLGKEIENKILTLDERRNSQELKFKS
jgi:hypothetical protein